MCTSFQTYTMDQPYLFLLASQGSMKTYLFTVCKYKCVIYRGFPERTSLGPAVARKPPLLSSPSSWSWPWAGMPDWLWRILGTTETLCFTGNISLNVTSVCGVCMYTVCVYISNREVFETYFPQSFLMPLWLFLFSGETGDCCPESTPKERGDWSDRTHSFSFSGWSARQKHKK